MLCVVTHPGRESFLVLGLKSWFHADARHSRSLDQHGVDKEKYTSYVTNINKMRAKYSDRPFAPFSLDNTDFPILEARLRQGSFRFLDRRPLVMLHEMEVCAKPKSGILTSLRREGVELTDERECEQSCSDAVSDKAGDELRQVLC